MMTLKRMLFNASGMPRMLILFESITMLFLYSYLPGHFANAQTELRLAIRLGHPSIISL